MRNFQSVLVTGGAGFIGSNFIRYLFSQDNFKGNIINLDALTYAGNLENLIDVQEKYGGLRYFFFNGNICDKELIEEIFHEYHVDTVVHFAAESHVDRSIFDPSVFLKTNVLGTQALLDICISEWRNRNDVIFHHVSTDEVYGSLEESGFFTERTPYDPRSPYSASKAASDHLVMAYYYTYGLPITISNCSNNYGPYQFPEKLIPLMIINMKERKPLPVYGDGRNIRDWIYVTDHCAAIWKIMQESRPGVKYNVGGGNEYENIELLRKLCKIYSFERNIPEDEILALITFVKDRPGHDKRYAIDCSKLENELGWCPLVDFEEGLQKTVKWYLENSIWTSHVVSGQYRNWIMRNYIDR